VNAREAILARLRAALADEPAPQPVPRDYGRDLDGDLVALFAERVADHGSRVHTSLGPALSDVETLLIPADTPMSWLEGFAGRVVVDTGAPAGALEAMDAVLTGCAVAVAETGTVVLDGGVAQGRRVATLIPDRHIVVVRTDQIVGRVPRALARLSPTRPQTWISGPSATSDIELNRVVGVHGPRRQDIVLWEAG
jgi:L-lactate dehydrogenase complex protein LldG